MIGVKLSGQAHELGILFPEILRGLRVWSAPTGCPWGFILLAVVLTGICCWCIGLACGAAIFSHQCRRVLHLGLNLATWSVAGTVGPVEVRDRLAQYQRRN